MLLPLTDLQSICSGYSGLRLLVLFGSRARGEDRPDSDWDFGYTAGADFDIDGLYADLAGVLRSDRIDLVDLDRAGAVLRFRAARDGRLIHQIRSGEWEQFQFESARFWCDIGPIVERASEQMLEESFP